ncbi:MAG: dihydrolipoamide acetyltransferase family protein [Hyphomicrobiaceae bacterium]
MKTFSLPDLGEGLTEAEIVAWHVSVGDHVVADQPILSVETAKAVVEVPSPWSGRIAALHHQPGDEVPVGEALVDIETDEPAHDTGTVVGTLPQAPPQPKAAANTPVPAAPPATPVKAPPAIRRLAQDLGVDLAQVHGTGPAGSITREDVEAAAATATTAPAPATDGYEPLRGVRRAMADLMARQAHAVVPASVSDEAVIDAWGPGTDPTIRLIRAAAAGCRAAPALNAWYDPVRKARRLHTRVDLGLAVNTDDGLFNPALRDIAGRDDADLRRGLDALLRDVRDRTVPLEELKGQTISLSNFGMLGGLTAALTIMPPQVAILGAGRIHEAPRAVAGAVRIVRLLPLSVTFDHRAVTGAEAIAFLNAVIADLARP